MVSTISGARRTAAVVAVLFAFASGCGSSDPTAVRDQNPATNPAEAANSKTVGEAGEAGADDSDGSTDAPTATGEALTPEDGEGDAAETGDDATAADPVDADESEPESQDDPGGTPEPVSDPPEPPSDPAFEARLDELIAFVEQERGHQFVSRPVVDRYEGADFVAEYAAILDRDAEEFQEDWEEGTDIYRALGIIDGSLTLDVIFTSFADAGVLGFYDNESERIVLRGGDVNPMVETTLVHELVHALDDQIFDIDRPEYDDRKDEVAWAFSALLEGNATEIENRFRAGFTPAQVEAERQARRELSRGTSLSSFSESFLDIQFSRYLHGFDLASLLWEEGRTAIDDALVDPPTTSEQVVHPELFLAGADADASPAPPVADGEVFSDGIFGEIAWKAILLDAVDVDSATRAAAGWGGDWYVAWRDGERACVRAHVAADTPADLDELAEALERWAGAGGDRSVFYPTADLVRVTACG